MSLLSGNFSITFRIEPFVIQLTTSIPSVMSSIENLYSDYTRLSPDFENFADFHVSINPPRNLRRWYKPQVLFYADYVAPFKPLPLSQAYPLFEWGLNWCIATSVHQYLIIHAAVIEKNGKALILCGHPGAGKSTLCAALLGAGWRLLSDEMAVVNLDTKKLLPIVRPVSLKNQSIDIIRNRMPDAVMGESFFDTAKGTVAHLKPPKSSVLQATAEAEPFWIVFPQFSPDHSSLSLEEIPKGQAVLSLAENSFNYNVLGCEGFSCVCDLVEQCECHSVQYNDLNQAIELFGHWADA